MNTTTNEIDRRKNWTYMDHPEFWKQYSYMHESDISPATIHARNKLITKFSIDTEATIPADIDLPPNITRAYDTWEVFPLLDGGYLMVVSSYRKKDHPGFTAGLSIIDNQFSYYQLITKAQMDEQAEKTKKFLSAARLREQQKEYYQRNVDRIKEYQKKYREKKNKSES